MSTMPQQKTLLASKTCRLYRWRDIRGQKPAEKVLRKFISGERVTVARFVFQKDGLVTAHKHKNEQVSCVLQGKLKFMVGGKQIVVGAGEILHIPSNVEHSAEAIEDTIDLDVFSPPRKDWI